MINKTLFAPEANQEKYLPTSVDLRPYSGDIHDQLTSNSCVANATATLLEIMLTMQGVNVEFSILDIYWDSREMNVETAGIDGGVRFHEALKSVSVDGVVEESEWPFELSNINTEPIYPDSAVKRFVDEYSYFPMIDKDATVSDMKLALNWGYPILVNMGTTEDLHTLKVGEEYIGSFANFKTGQHSVVAVAYDDNLNGGSIIFENSWTEEFADGGYFSMSYDVLWKDIDDMMIVKTFAESNMTEQEAVVGGLYRDILGRLADNEGLEFWSGMVTDDEMIYRDVSRSMYLSEEFSNNDKVTDFVEDVYHEVLGREADANGHDFYIESGVSEVELVGIFMASQEFINGW